MLQHAMYQILSKQQNLKTAKLWYSVFINNRFRPTVWVPLQCTSSRSLSLNTKGFATATCVLRIWILELKAATNQGITVVQLHAKQVQQ